MQNDVVMEGGAFASSGSPIHCREQNAIDNVRRLAEHCRRRGVPVIHVWFCRRADGRNMTLNAPLFEGAIGCQRDGRRHLGRRTRARAGGPAR